MRNAAVPQRLLKKYPGSIWGVLSCGNCVEHGVEQATWINTQCLCQSDEFHNVDTALIAFDLGHIGLWLSEAVGDLLLRQASIAPCIQQDGG